MVEMKGYVIIYNPDRPSDIEFEIHTQGCTCSLERIVDSWNIRALSAADARDNQINAEQGSDEDDFFIAPCCYPKKSLKDLPGYNDALKRFYVERKRQVVGDFEEIPYPPRKNDARSCPAALIQSEVARHMPLPK